MCVGNHLEEVAGRAWSGPSSGRVVVGFGIERMWASGAERPAEKGKGSWQTIVSRGVFVCTHVFPNDLLQSRTENLPREYLDVLFNVSRLWIWESHDQLEEILTPRLALGHGDRSESFQISADPVFLLDSEARADQRLEQVDGVDRSDKTLILILPEDARDDDGLLLLRVVVLGERSERSENGGAFLASPKLHQASAIDPLVL
jgi:hypothetical protein